MSSQEREVTIEQAPITRTQHVIVCDFPTCEAFSVLFGEREVSVLFGEKDTPTRNWFQFRNRRLPVDHIFTDDDITLDYCCAEHAVQHLIPFLSGYVTATQANPGRSYPD